MTKNSLFFGITKWIAFALALCALAGCAYSLIITLKSFGPSHFDIPEFNAKSYSKEKRRFSMDAYANDPQVQQERLTITKQYGDRILAVITTRALTRMKVEEIVAFMHENIPAERYGDFVAGWEAYLNKGMAFLQENNLLLNTSGDELSKLFRTAFHESLDKSKSETRQSEHDRIIYLGASISLALLFVMAMIVPFLAAIEANTRCLRSSISAAAINTAASSLAPVGTPCKACNAPVAPGDVFCGECGAGQGTTS